MSSDDEKTASLVPSRSHALTHGGSARLVQRGMQDLLAAEAERLLKKGLVIESTQQQDAGKARSATAPDELKKFEHETERARQIAASHPRFWEYLLTEELMRSKLSAIEQKYDEFDRCGLGKTGTARKRPANIAGCEQNHRCLYSTAGLGA